MGEPGRPIRTIAISLAVVAAATLAAAGAYISRSAVWRKRPEPDAVATASPATPIGLSDAARQTIWDIEQQAFHVLYKAGPKLTEALCSGDRAGLLDLLAPDFEGAIFAADSAETIERGLAQFRYQRDPEHRTVPADREQFADWLLGQVRLFDGPPRAQLPLLYLAPVDRDHMEGAWQGTWILRLFGAMSDGGPGEIYVRGRFRCDADPIACSKQPGWIRGWVLEQVSLAHATQPLMKEVGALSGIDIAALHDNWVLARSKFVGTPGGVFACDYNNDGIVDLLITDDGPPMLYAGRGDGTFEDVTIEVGLPLERPTSGLALFADLDNDGDEDLVLGSAVLENRNGRFLRRGYLPLDSRASGLSVADYDGDGLLDIYVSNAAGAPHRATGRTSWVDDHSGAPNVLWRNRGDFRFEDVTEAAGAAAGERSTFTSVWLDADDDGWPDLYVINELGPNLLLRNEHNGSFSEHHVGPDFDGFTMGVAAGDVLGTGRIDLYLANMFSKAGLRIIANVPRDAYPPALMEKMHGFVSGNTLLGNRGGLRFDPAGNSSIAQVGWAYGPALIDLDGDGLLDIYSTAGFASFSRKEPDG